MRLELRHILWVALLALTFCSANLRADERRFSYTYEPETLPKGDTEFETWITLRSQRNKTVGQENFNRWELRQALEYGVNDRYTVEFYLNEASQSYRNPATGEDISESRFGGVSLENRYMMLNPAEHVVGLTLYLEARFSGDEAEVEQKIILGRRQGNWKWAFNLTHATEWSENFHKAEGELEASLGISRDLNPHWSIGLELRDHNELPDYQKWENTALFLGPVISCRREKWWAVLSVLPQIYGVNHGGDPDGNRHLELEGHERLNVRFLFGIDF